MLTTKDKILSVMIDHIKKETDIKNISLSQIALEAEIGKSTVYEHFASKEDLISETYMYLLKQYEAILTSDIEKMDFKSAFIEQMAKISYVMHDAKMIMNAIMNNHQQAFPNFSKDIEKCVKNIQFMMNERFESIIYLGVVEGILPTRSPKPYMRHVIQALISGLLFQYVNGEIEIEETDLFDLIYTQTVHVIQQK